MCGFAGQVGREPGSRELLEGVALRMNACIRHRGPDSAEVWVDPGCRVALAFSRLAIQDLSPAANQPMHSESGRYTIVFNGEIYNTDELQHRIGRAPQSFRTHSDTEVLLAAIEKLGLEATLRAANGMFAIALWDQDTGTMFLARDRLGKKPLHYTVDGGGAVRFASEIKSILAVDEGSRNLDAPAIQAFFALTYIPAPLTILGGIRKVRPGCILEIQRGLVAQERPYWSLQDVLQHSGSATAPYEELLERADTLLEDAVRRRLISDVPVGLLQSGGVDSSLIAHMLTRIGAGVESFTIGVDDASLDESITARNIAARLGIKHSVLRLSQADSLQLVDTVFDFLDEPFGDPSAIPTYAVCHLARSHATVLLSGDGGDEVFGGYPRHLWGVGARKALAHVYSRFRTRSAILTRQQIALEIYRRVMSSGDSGGSMNAGHLRKLVPALEQLPSRSLLDYLRFLDFQLYLPDDILVKVDRMSMATSIELRSPFLDSRLVEFSWTLPDSALLHGNLRKRITTDLFRKHIGPEWLQTQKHGFAAPIVDWLLGPLRPQLETALEEVPRQAQIPWSAAFLSDLRRRLPERTHLVAYRAWQVFSFWRWLQRWRNGNTLAASANN